MMDRLWTWVGNPKATSAFAGAIVLLAFVLRVHRLGEANIWLDEGLSIGLAKQSLVALSLTQASSVHPPLYFAILHFWIQIAQASEFSLRFPSVFFGTLAVAALFLLGKKAGGGAAGLGGALLLAIARLPVEWSQEIRMYALASFLVLLSLIFFWTFLKRPSWQSGLGYALSSTAALYTLYLSGLVLVIENLALLFFLPSWPKPRGRFILSWLGLQFLALVLYSPWLFLAAEGVRIGSGQPAAWPILLRLWGSLLTVGISTNIHRFDLINGVLAAVLLAGFFMARHPRPDKRTGGALGLLGLFLLLPPLFLLLASQMKTFIGNPRLEARYFLPFMAPVYLLLAISILSFAARLRLLGLGAFLFFLTLSGFSLHDYYAGRILRDDLQSMMLTLQAHRLEGDGVVVISGRMPVFLYYFDRYLGPDQYHNFHALPHAPPFSRRDIRRGLLPFTQTYSRIWLIQDERHFPDPAGLAQTWLEAHARSLLDLPFAHNRLTLYATQDTATPLSVALFQPQHLLNTELTPEILVLGYDLPVRKYAPRDFLHLGLYLKAQDPAQGWLIWQDARGETIARREIKVEPLAGEVVRIAVEMQVPEEPVPGPSLLLLYWEGAVRSSLLLEEVMILVPHKFLGD